ncbi:MAG: cytochrome oxidase assembly protein [Chitinophagaceae bacterium]|nr:cytochrome oxidase assembly protein [Chitinophagaceae bacterium]
MSVSRSSRPVAMWLLTGVFMLVVQILLGGITRLTGSGLSITEWDVITGSLPPLNEHQWLNEFHKYQQTPQFRLLNTGFTLNDFKSIFFWEWFHRFWARLMGIVFLMGFVIFWFQKRFTKEMVRPFLILFLLGALQGAVGWIMVASGLTGDAVYVRPTKLALHFIFAMVLICYTFWFALKLLVQDNDRIYSSKIKKYNLFLLILLTIQLIYGALMAGHKAASAAPTWPDINGYYVLPNLFNHQPVIVNFVENTALIHFIHRNLAYIIFVFIAILTALTKKIAKAGLVKKIYLLPFLFVCIQVILGVLTVLNSIHIIPNRWGIFEWMAQLHQLFGMLLLLSLVLLLYAVNNKKKSMPYI